MNPKQKLLAWVEQQHKGHFIRKSNLPYVHHLMAVADTAAIIPLGYETGLCHDLFENTDVTQLKLTATLELLGYHKTEADIITSSVAELTDVFTKVAFPNLTKSMRKAKEADRLTTISPFSQTVKYADLIYNINWMMIYDRKHAEKYLWNKLVLLRQLTKGDSALHLEAIRQIENALQQF